MSLYENITQAIGNTPLIKLNNIDQDLPGNIYAKVEFFNPMNSVKDRLALALIEDGEKKGLINQTTTIIEATSGNTGIGLAMICAQRNYQCVLIMPDSVSTERISVLKGLGAGVVLTPAEQGMQGTLDKAKELLQVTKNSYMPKQFENESNVEMHRMTTAQEILKDMEGLSIDYFVAGVGTGGTLTGVGEILKEQKGSKIIALEPKKSAVLSGMIAGSHPIQGIGAGFIPTVLNTDIIDEIILVDKEMSLKGQQLLSHREGIFAGMSSGVALSAAIEVAKRNESQDKNIVVIIPDLGERYLSTWLFDQVVE